MNSFFNLTCQIISIILHETNKNIQQTSNNSLQNCFPLLIKHINVILLIIFTTSDNQFPFPWELNKSGFLLMSNIPILGITQKITKRTIIEWHTKVIIFKISNSISTKTSKQSMIGNTLYKSSVFS